MLKHSFIFAILALALGLNVPAQKSSKSPRNEGRGGGGGGGQQITEITLERTACFGTCPMYKVTLRRDGTFAYVGQEYVEHKGAYTGRFYGFERLADLVEERGYFNLRDNYTINATDLPSTVTSVVRAGRRKTITNYGDLGPLELWAIEKAIDGVMANVKWEKAVDK